MGEVWHWVVVGFSFGVGFEFASRLIGGVLGLVGGRKS